MAGVLEPFLVRFSHSALEFRILNLNEVKSLMQTWKLGLTLPDKLYSAALRCDRMLGTLLRFSYLFIPLFVSKIQENKRNLKCILEVHECI